MKQKSGLFQFSLGIMIITLNSCLQNIDFTEEMTNCMEASPGMIGFSELKQRYNGETVQIVEDLKLDAYVASSDHRGNFFGVIYLQNNNPDEASGLRFEIDLRDSHLFYPAGTKVRVHLKGLYLGKQNDLYELGGAFPVFGRVSVGRLPSALVTEHLVSLCDPPMSLEANICSIEELNDALLGTRISLEGVEFAASELGSSFANPKEETTRTLVDCSGNAIALVNSGFSDFQEQILPSGNGLAQGVLIKKNRRYQMIINELEDLVFSQDRCTEDRTNGRHKNVIH